MMRSAKPRRRAANPIDPPINPTPTMTRVCSFIDARIFERDLSRRGDYRMTPRFFERRARIITDRPKTTGPVASDRACTDGLLQLPVIEISNTLRDPAL